jgi:hypothetical protein
VRDGLEAHDDTELVTHVVHEILHHGSGSSAQREAYARRGELADVVNVTREAAPGDRHGS